MRTSPEDNHNSFLEFLLFIIRVKRELKRVCRNGCRYNERLNAETGGSKTPHTRCAGKHIVSLVLVVSQVLVVLSKKKKRRRIFSYFYLVTVKKVANSQKVLFQQ
jgi:hypothetical protein